MVFKNLSKEIEKLEEIIRKEESGSNNISREEYDSLNFMEFLIAQSIIQDIGETTALQIANHILAYCKNDIEY